MRQCRELRSAGTAGHPALPGENSRARSTAGSFPHVQGRMRCLERDRVILMSAGVTAEGGPGCPLAGPGLAEVGFPGRIMSLETLDALWCRDSPRGMINTAHATQARGTEGGCPAATTPKVELKTSNSVRKNPPPNLRATFPCVRFGLN